MMDWAGIGADLMGGLGGLFGGNGSNPADSAMPYLNQIPGMLNGVYSPYMNAGMGALGGLQGYERNGLAAGNSLQGYLQNGLNAGTSLQQQLGRLANDPTGLMNSWGKTFQSSPGYNFQVNQALGAANRAAAAGGMAGSPAEQQSIAGTVNNMANQDYYNYINHAQGLYGMGLSGLQNMYNTGLGAGQDLYNTGAQIGSNIYDTGANMANNYGTNLAQAYMNQGNLAYAGQENQNQAQGGMWGSLGAGLMGAAGMMGWL